MPFLTINGQTIQVAVGSGSRTISKVGKRSRAYRGQLRDGTRGKRRGLTFRACFQDHEYADTMISVINGDGHVAFLRRGFDADTGLQPEIGSLVDTHFDKTASPFTGFETGSIRSEGDGMILRYDAQLCDEWTIHFWYQVDGTGWQVRTMRDDGVTYTDGVRVDTDFGVACGNFGVDVIDGRVEVNGFGSDVTWLHHLALLPYRAHTDFIETWHAAAKPWSGLPVVRVEGDALVTDHELFFGKVTGSTFIGKPQQVSPFGWVNNAQIVEFELSEVAQGFVYDDTVPT